MIMATRQEIMARAKQLIEQSPSAGKARINKQLQAEFGVGLRSSAVLKLKEEVATAIPSLAPELYRTGGVPKGLNDIYKGWRNAGFLPFEARELTVGHGERYRAFDAKAVFDSAPGEAARQTRTDLIRQQLRNGWTRKQIRENIIDFYLKSRKFDPWRHIRAEYKPLKKVDYRDYQGKARRRAKVAQKRLMRTTPVASSKEEWIEQLKERIHSSKNLQERERLKQQIVNLGGTP